MIKIQNISRKFVSGKSITDALIEVNLEIQTGEFVALMGPSGSGKTTLLNIIGGLDSPNEGSIIIGHKNISEYNDQELSRYRNHQIGFIFQEFHLEHFLDVRQNILLPTYFNKSYKEGKKYADKLLKEVELSSKAESKINELSGGQKQRAAIARALINKPKIILADEPTGNLDLKTGKTIIDLLKTIHHDHKSTMIIATHDEHIAKSAQRIIQIQDGKIIKQEKNAH